MDKRWRNFGIIIVIIIVIVLFYFMGPSIILSDNQDNCDVNPILVSGGVDPSNLDSYFDLGYVELTALNSKLSECITTDAKGIYHKALTRYLLLRSELEAAVSLTVSIDSDEYCGNVFEFEDIVKIINEITEVSEVLNSPQFSEYSNFNSKIETTEDLSDLRETMVSIVEGC